MQSLNNSCSMPFVSLSFNNWVTRLHRHTSRRITSFNRTLKAGLGQSFFLIITWFPDLFSSLTRIKYKNVMSKMKSSNSSQGRTKINQVYQPGLLSRWITSSVTHKSLKFLINIQRGLSSGFHSACSEFPWSTGPTLGISFGTPCFQIQEIFVVECRLFVRKQIIGSQENIYWWMPVANTIRNDNDRS